MGVDVSVWVVCMGRRAPVRVSVKCCVKVRVRLTGGGGRSPLLMGCVGTGVCLRSDRPEVRDVCV